MTLSRLASLAWPERRYRIYRLRPGGKASKGFETKTDARLEDRRRRKRLARATKSAHRLIDQRALRSLLDRLLTAEQPNAKPAPTLASHRYTRDQRIRFTGALLKLVEKYPANQLRTFTLLPAGWEIPAADLNETDPKKLLARLRSTLVRLGASQANGFLIAVLHGEFEPGEKVYRLHVHGLAGGEMIAVVDKLRWRAGYRRRKDVYYPVVLQELRNRPNQLSYLFKSYWHSKRIGPVGSEGKRKRDNKGKRLSEPYHSQKLLWLDRFDLGDLTLLIHCRVESANLVLSNTV